LTEQFSAVKSAPLNCSSVLDERRADDRPRHHPRPPDPDHRAHGALRQLGIGRGRLSECVLEGCAVGHGVTVASEDVSHGQVE
jgi:hypothetical protein